MNMKCIKKMGFLAIVLIIGFILIQPTVGNEKNVVERPFMVKSDGIIDLSTNKSFDIGVGTHIGRFVGEGKWNEKHDESEYTIIAANEDEIYATVYVDSAVWNGLQWSGYGHGVWEGGTGRFEKLIGKTEFTGEGYLDPVENKLYYQLNVKGWISY